MTVQISLKEQLEDMVEHYFCGRCCFLDTEECDGEFWDNNCARAYTAELNPLIEQLQAKVQEIHNKIDFDYTYEDYVEDTGYEYEVESTRFLDNPKAYEQSTFF